MKMLQRLNRLDLLAGTSLIVLVVFSFLLIIYMNWVGITVRLQTTNPSDQISPYETVTLTFSQPVRPGDVENQLQLQPANVAKLDWQNDRTLRIVPTQPYLGTLSIHLFPGKLGANGEWMRRDVAWTLTVRPPSIVYLNYAEPKNELMVIPVEGGTARQLTSTNGQVVDFNVSLTGNQIAYTTANNQQGSDLWVMDRDGKNARRLLSCGTGRCYLPTWSPDSRWLAYTQELPLPTPAQDGSTHGLPRLWVVNVETAESRSVFSNSQATGTGALWSPDGNWLASYDLKILSIRIIEFKSGKEILLPSRSNQLGSWSPDSKSFLYPNFMVDPIGTILKNSLVLVNIESGERKVLLVADSDENNYRYGIPFWSASGDQIALSMLSVRRYEIPRLWVFQVDQPEKPTMTGAPGYSYDFYQWDIYGTGLLIQQTSMTKAYLFEIAIWHPSQGYRVVGKDGFLPHWLP